MRRRPLTVPTSGTIAVAEDYGDTPTPNAVWVTPDGAQVGGPGAWRQLAQLLPEAYAANWAVTDWYIDGTVGLDTNNGTTALTPLRTGAELLRRLGPYALWGQSVTVHVLANGMTDALVVQGCMLNADTHIDVIGEATLLLADTVATYTAMNHATPIGTEITATGIADWTPYQWKRIRITAGARAGTIAWALKQGPNGTTLDHVRTTRPQRIDATHLTTPVATSSFAPGDPIVIESLPYVSAVTINVDGALDFNAGARYPKRLYLLSDLNIGGLYEKSVSELILYRNFVWACQVLNVTHPSASSQNGQSQLTACLMLQTDPATNGLQRVTGSFLGCGFGTTTAGTNPGVSASQPSLFSSCTFQGVRLRLDGIPCGSYVTQHQIFDVPIVNQAAFDCTGLFVQNISGNGNVGYGFELFNNYEITFFGTVNLKGALGDVVLASAPPIPLTYAQATPTSDFAQKGTSAAMVAGTITITVPWYDNVNQKVTATHAVFAGTPGILSVQQISTTQFTITSSSAIDTSTVNWQISPLGRNIFITTA